MDPNDIANAVFELGGACLLWINVKKLQADKQVRGVFWPVTGFFGVWGLWNLYYYPSLDQWASFAAGIVLVSANIVWVCLAIHYRKN